MKTKHLMLIIVIVLLGLLFYMEDQRHEAEQWKHFFKCSENEGDAGCDSCFYLVFGYYAEDPGYLDYTPLNK